MSGGLDERLAAHGIEVQQSTSASSSTNGCICCTTRASSRRSGTSPTTAGTTRSSSSRPGSPGHGGQTLSLELDEPVGLRPRGRRRHDHGRRRGASSRTWAPRTTSSSAAGPTTKRTRARWQLMAEQVEFATIIVINKCDRGRGHPHPLEALIADLNPSARILRTEHAASRSTRCSTRAASCAQAAPGWAQALTEAHARERPSASGPTSSGRACLHPGATWSSSVAADEEGPALEGLPLVRDARALEDPRPDGRQRATVEPAGPGAPRSGGRRRVRPRAHRGRLGRGVRGHAPGARAHRRGPPEARDGAPGRSSQGVQHGEELWLTFDDPLPGGSGSGRRPDAHEGHAHETADAS